MLEEERERRKEPGVKAEARRLLFTEDERHGVEHYSDGDGRKISIKCNSNNNIRGNGSISATTTPEGRGGSARDTGVSTSKPETVLLSHLHIVGSARFLARSYRVWMWQVLSSCWEDDEDHVLPQNPSSPPPHPNPFPPFSSSKRAECIG